MLAGLGISTLILLLPAAVHILRFAGAAYLIYLAIKTWRADPRLTLATGGLGRRAGWGGYFAQGLANNLVNAKMIPFFLALFPQFIQLDGGNAALQSLVLGLTLAAIALVWVGGSAAFAARTEPHRRELTVHCYRMLGSLQEAEDMVQETFLRAWHKLDTYEGRAPFRAWLYKIATNACLDTLQRRHRRVPPPRAATADPHAPQPEPLLEPVWLEPIPDDLLAGVESSPAARYDARESISLAFLAAIQTLPPRQRAVLILCDVLDWRSAEAAALLNLSVSAVNSALHRARTTLARRYQRGKVEVGSGEPLDADTRALLERYVRAWEAAHMDDLLALLKEDASFAMPPLRPWLRGREAIRVFVAANILDGEARGRWRLRPTRANGAPAFGWYRRDEADGGYRAFAIQVLALSPGLIADITTFPLPGLFGVFGLPLTI